MFKEIILGYEVERKKVKNINLRIRSDLSIYISAPVNLHSSYIENFILSKKEWIDKNIIKIKEIKNRREVTEYMESYKVKYYGRYYDLKIINSNFDKIIFKDNEFYLYTKNNEREYNKKIFEKFYFLEAEKILPKLLDKWKKIMNLNYERHIFKKIKGKWGYCNYNKKIIALNIDLIKRSFLEIEYVIIHELAHLKYPNHSKDFYRYIESFMKNYKDAELLLKREI